MNKVVVDHLQVNVDMAIDFKGLCDIFTKTCLLCKKDALVCFGF